MSKNKKIIWIIAIIALVLLLPTVFPEFTLFENNDCGFVGALDCADGEDQCRMCLPNGQWSGLLNCINGKCGLRDVWGVPGYCQWLDVGCHGKYIMMCSRNGVFTQIGKVDGYCGYSISGEPVSEGPPPIAKCSGTSETCVGKNFYQCEYSSYRLIGKIEGKCGYSESTNPWTVTETGNESKLNFGEEINILGFKLTLLQIILIAGGIILVLIIIK